MTMMTTTTTTSSKMMMIRLNKLVAAKVPCSRMEAETLIGQGRVMINGVVADSPGAKFPAQYKNTTHLQILHHHLDQPSGVTVVSQQQSSSALSSSSSALTSMLQQKVTIMLNKPLGYVSTQPEPGKKPAVKLLTSFNELNNNYNNNNNNNPIQQQQQQQQNKIQPQHGGSGTSPFVLHVDDETTSTSQRQRRPRGSRTRGVEPYQLPKMAVAGRLDINTTGLLLFTQSGAIAAQIIGETSTVEKEYLVRLTGHDRLTGDYVNVHSRLTQLRQGIVDDGQFLTAQSVVVQNDDQLLITLTSGKRHQIRRMVRAVGWHIQAIKRTRIGPLRLGSLPIGQWRYVAPHELMPLFTQHHHHHRTGSSGTSDKNDIVQHHHSHRRRHRDGGDINISGSGSKGGSQEEKPTPKRNKLVGAVAASAATGSTRNTSATTSPTSSPLIKSSNNSKPKKIKKTTIAKAHRQ